MNVQLKPLPTTEEGIVINSVHTGYQTYHGESLLGTVLTVRAEDNGGTFTFLPPRITLDGETYNVVGLNAEHRIKTYFRPFSNDSPEPSRNYYPGLDATARALQQEAALGDGETDDDHNG